MSAVFGHDYRVFVVQPFTVEQHKKKSFTLTNPSDPNNEGGVVLHDDGGDSEGRDQSLIVPNGYVRYRTTLDDSLLIEPPIQMTATFAYNLTGKGDSSDGKQTCEISLYNLSDETLSKIKSGYNLILNAGYKTQKELPIAFCGDIISVITNREKGDRVTKIVVQEGKYAKESLTNRFIFDRNSGGAISYRDMLDVVVDYIRDNNITVEVNSSNYRASDYNVPQDDRSIVRQTVGIPMGADSQQIPPDNWKSPLKGLVYSGNVFTTLTEICNEIDHIWFFSKGVLYIRHNSQSALYDSYLITPDVVIGNVTYYDETDAQSSGEGSESGDATQGITFSTFFNSKIALENNIRITYGAYAGDYVVTEVRHELNYQGVPWQSVIKCKQSSSFVLNKEQ